MKKSIEMSVKFDTSDFDKSVDRMQARLKDLYAPADLVRSQTQMASKMREVGYGGAGGPDQSLREKATVQHKKEMARYLEDEYRKQDSLSRMYYAREKTLSSLKKNYSDMVASGKEDLRTKEQITKIEATQYRTREEYQKREASLNKILGEEKDRQDEVREKKQEQRTRRLKMIGTFGAVVAGGATLYSQYLRTPLQALAAGGRAVQSTVGQEAETVYNRRSAFEAAWNPERARAAQMAMEGNKGFGLQAGGNFLGNVVGGATAGAVVGSAAGGIGAIPGAALGGIAGGVKGLADPTQRSLLLSHIPGAIGDRFGQQYQNLKAADLGEQYQQALSNEKLQNPGKFLASQYYEQNYMGNLQAQRGMGINDEGLYGKGGLLQGGANAGFTDQMTLNAGQGILGAGGSSRSAFGNATFSNQLQRNMNMTNAPQVLGAISGGVGGAEGTKQATIKILAEGMRLGLDDSKFAEENRRFTQAAAEIIGRSGAQNDTDFGKIAGGFGRFVTENTVQGIGAAKSAYEQYQQISSTITGPRGVMKMAGFMSDPNLKQLSTMEMQALGQVPDTELNKDNPLVYGLANKYGIDPDKFVDSVKAVQEGTVSRFASTDQARDRLRKSKVDVSRALTDNKYFKSITKQQQDDITALNVSGAAELGYTNQRQMAAFTAGEVTGPRGFGQSATRENLAADRATRGDTGRVGDETVATTAKDFGLILQNFRDFKTEIIPSAKAVSAFTDQIKLLMIALGSATEKEIPAMVKALVEARAKNQVQAGKKGP